MRNRPIFQKVREAPAIKEMSLFQLQTLDEVVLKAVVLNTEEQREYRKYSSGIKELLVKDFLSARWQSELNAVLDKLRGEFPNVQGMLSHGTEIKLWLHGDMPKMEED